MFKFVLGFSIGIMSSFALAQTQAKVDTNGVLLGFIVQKDGEEVCRDPSVWLQFRGPDSYIICPE